MTDLQMASETAKLEYWKIGVEGWRETIFCIRVFILGLALGVCCMFKYLFWR